MSTEALSEAHYRKALLAHAETLWQLYIDTMASNPKLAAQIKAQADTAFDLGFEFSRQCTRNELEKLRAQREEVARCTERVSSYAR